MTNAPSTNRDFYPEIEPYQTGYLDVSPIHQIFYEEVGNPQGDPIVFLHGGPGGGINSDHRRFFDPQFYRIILFDQRGCGKSKPFAELHDNSTWHLIDDIEKLRSHLKVDKWKVFGGSWGSTLALAYAISHPDRVKALILRGIFLCRPSEIRWFYQEGASQICPDAWEIYESFIPAEEKHDLVKAYHRRLTSSDSNVQLEAARRWSQWEMATSYLLTKSSAIAEMEDPQKALPFARIESHYFVNNSFFPSDNFLIENIEKVRKIPAVLIQGRYDLVCPMRSAWDLHRAWPEAELIVVPDAGHAASEPGIRSNLVAATDRFKKF